MFFCETLLFRTCETKVLSKLAINETRVADAGNFFGGLIHQAVRPHFAVEVVEGRQQLGLMLEKDFAVWRRLYSHGSNYRRIELRLFGKCCSARRQNSLLSTGCQLRQSNTAADEGFEHGQSESQVG